jgi:hypothetical protein
METRIYCKFSDLPASKIAQEQFEKAQEMFNLTCQAIKNNLKIAEDIFVMERNEARKNVKWEYSVTITLKDAKYYHIHRKALNPVQGDTEFYREIDYASFKIVNNVFISMGSGYLFKNIKNGDVLHPEEIDKLNNNVVPEIFK